MHIYIQYLLKYKSINIRMMGIKDEPTKISNIRLGFIVEHTLGWHWLFKIGGGKREKGSKKSIKMTIIHSSILANGFHIFRFFISTLSLHLLLSNWWLIKRKIYWNWLNGVTSWWQIVSVFFCSLGKYWNDCVFFYEIFMLSIFQINKSISRIFSEPFIRVFLNISNM